MKKFSFLISLITLLLLFPINKAISDTIDLDALTPETGSNLTTEPLVTPYGTISYNGYLTGGVFWHDFTYPVTYSEFMFDFDVDSFDFLIGGAMGGIYIELLDINDSVVNSYHTLDLAVGQQVSLSGSGVRRFTFVDGRLTGGESEVWDLVVTTSAPVVPEPISSILFIVGGATLGFRRFRKKFKK